MRKYQIGDVFEHWAGEMRLVVRSIDENGRLNCAVAKNGTIEQDLWSLSPLTLEGTYYKVGTVSDVGDSDVG